MKTTGALCASLTLLSVEAASRGRRRLDMEGAVTDAGYDSYATSWRYLGAYLDCSSSSVSSSVSSFFSKRCTYCNGGGGRRSTCKNPTRKLLWAAYFDPSYEGDQIGEYQYYDTDDGGWDDSTCVGDRCAKMDCHDPYNTNWELMGVYKESVSFDDDNFYEQLFKHQGYCLWDGDKEDGDYDSQDNDAWESGSTYSFMQAMRKELPEGCTQISSSFPDGKTYYVDMKPLSNGDTTLGVYKDSSCVEESKYTYEDYQQSSYASSALTASASSGAFDTWNSGMDAYKICQPCRAYNREETENNGDWNGRNRNRRRRLGEENDGQGDEEQNGYNCYDDAGYQNCNQCYKFETHSDMEEASASDLQAASSQGTILRINYNGAWYGNGFVGDVTQGSEEKNNNQNNERQQKSSQKRSSWQSSWQSSHSRRYGVNYGFVGGGLAILALGATAQRRGTLDNDVVEDEDDAYVEMAEPR